MPRAYWKGYLRLSLVTCPIELFPATSQSEKTHFHQINTRTGHRLLQQMVDEETGRPVDSEHKGRGYELSKGRYVEIDEDELKAIQIESTHTVDIDGFVPRSQIDKRYLDKPYYIAPNGKTGAEAFVVIRDAMQDEERVALARIVTAHREHIIMLTRRCLRPTSCMGVRGYCRWTPVEPAGTCPDYKSSKLDGSGDPWTTGAGDERSAIGGGSLA